MQGVRRHIRERRDWGVMNNQKLTDELEKALRDEAYDGGMGALGPEEFTDYVRGLAVTAAKVVEEAHTPADDEQDIPKRDA